MARRLARLVLLVSFGVPLLGCPDDEPDDPINDMLIEVDGSSADATPSDGGPPDGDLPDVRIGDVGPPDGAAPDAAPPAPTADRAPLIDVCTGCGVARSADYVMTHKVVPRSPRTARSADFTMELHAAPIAPEDGR